MPSDTPPGSAATWTREELAEVLGVALTRRLRQSRYWTEHNGVRVRVLANDLAEDVAEAVERVAR